MKNETNHSESPMSRGSQFIRQMLAAERRIYGFILTLVHNVADAEDILQETAALMWTRYHETPEIVDFVAWGIRIAHYKVLEFRKKQYRSRILFTDEVFEQILGGTASVNENLQERFDALQACLAKLSDEDRRLILMKHKKKATAKTLAESLHMTADTVYKSVPRIHNLLLRCVLRSLREQGAL